LSFSPAVPRSTMLQLLSILLSMLFAPCACISLVTPTGPIASAVPAAPTGPVALVLLKVARSGSTLLSSLLNSDVSTILQHEALSWLNKEALAQQRAGFPPRNGSDSLQLTPVEQRISAAIVDTLDQGSLKVPRIPEVIPVSGFSMNPKTITRVEVLASALRRWTQQSSGDGWSLAGVQLVRTNTVKRVIAEYHGRCLRNQCAHMSNVPAGSTCAANAIARRTSMPLRVLTCLIARMHLHEQRLEQYSRQLVAALWKDPPLGEDGSPGIFRMWRVTYEELQLNPVETLHELYARIAGRRAVPEDGADELASGGADHLVKATPENVSMFLTNYDHLLSALRVESPCHADMLASTVPTSFDPCTPPLDLWIPLCPATMDDGVEDECFWTTDRVVARNGWVHLGEQELVGWATGWVIVCGVVWRVWNGVRRNKIVSETSVRGDQEC